MSEAIEGLPYPPPATPKNAAAVLLYRRSAETVELFWIKRGKKLSFGPGFFAFPGGRVDPADAHIPVEGASGQAAAMIACAARELFEEAGILIAQPISSIEPGKLSEDRRRLIDGEAFFIEVLERHRLSLKARDFAEAGRWITPEFLPSRFDARYYLVECPPGQSAQVWEGELTLGEWITPQAALKKWEAGQALLHTPNLHGIKALANWTDVESAIEALSSPPNCPGFIAQEVEFQKGFRVVPLRTPTLPPATHTNTYLLGNRELLIVDPGAEDERELKVLIRDLDRLSAQGARPKAVFLTHHHKDHIGGARALKDRLRLPVWAHPMTAEKLGADLRVDRPLVDGDRIDLAGDPPLSFLVLHTPGHAQGHLCLVDARSKAAIVGDMVAGIGTILIDPPEGDMCDYLSQLERLKALPVGTLYPAHGPAISDGPAKLAEYIEHRAMREGRVLEALRASKSNLPEIAAQAYADVPMVFPPLAERSTLAVLLKLVKDGRAEEDHGTFRALP